jgi:NADP-dependent 3-hydroxy acid dehydrogenase YdfG
MRQLTDEVFLVTGGLGAIAQSIVAALLDAGARVALVDLDGTRAAARAAELGPGRAIGIGADLRRREEALRMVDEARGAFGRIDGLVHTAGGFAMAPLEQTDEATYDTLFDGNVRTLFHALAATVPQLRAAGRGFVCGISSTPGWSGASPGAAVYGAAKSAVATLLRSLDGELVGTDVAVSVLFAMGVVDTAANRAAMPDADPATFIDPSDLAEAVVHAARRSPRGRVVELPVRPRRG